MMCLVSSVSPDQADDPSASVFDLGRQDRDGPRGDITLEQAVHAERSEVAYEWLLQQAERTVASMRVLRVRCPAQGCLLAEVFRFPLKPSGERFLARSITNRHSHVGFLNWAFSDDWFGPRVWYPAACRHGEGKLYGAWLFDLVGLVRGWHHHSETLEEARARAPESEGRGIARRVFHPPADAWRSKS
jgi:hypothetical protein